MRLPWDSTRRASIVTLLALASASAYAEIEKVAVACDNTVCFHWWPKLPEVTGWHHDRDYSLHYGFNAQAPEGRSFADAETVIYANAPYKPRMAETKTLQALIEDDQQRFQSKFPGVEIVELEPIATADGQRLRSFSYSPTKSGSWEIVSYGEEGEFFLVFTVSSRTKEGLANGLGDYRQFINGYRAGS